MRIPDRPQELIDRSKRRLAEYTQRERNKYYPNLKRILDELSFHPDHVTRRMMRRWYSKTFNVDSKSLEHNEEFREAIYLVIEDWQRLHSDYVDQYTRNAAISGRSGTRLYTFLR